MDIWTVVCNYGTVSFSGVNLWGDIFRCFTKNKNFGPITFFWAWAWLQVQIRLIESYLPWNRGFDEFFGQLLGGQDYYSRRKCLKLRNHGNLCGYDLRTHEGPVRDTSKKYQPFLYADKDSVKKGFWVIRLRHDKWQWLWQYFSCAKWH